MGQNEETRIKRDHVNRMNDGLAKIAKNGKPNKPRPLEC
jgi:uncharacterized protein (DUF2225 family)